MRRPSCGFIAATGRTRRWTSERSLVSIRPCRMPDSTATSNSDACCTITSRGQPRPRWLVTTTQRTMCRTACTSRSGHGMDSLVARSKSRAKLFQCNNRFRRYMYCPRCGKLTRRQRLTAANAGILLAIGGWHIQTLIRTQMLTKQWKRRAPLNGIQATPFETPIASATTAKLLDQADFADAIPASVTEHTTRHLAEAPQPKSRL